MATTIFKKTIGNIMGKDQEIEIISHGKMYHLYINSNNPILSHTNYGYVKKYVDGYLDGYELGLKTGLDEE